MAKLKSTDLQKQARLDVLFYVHKKETLKLANCKDEKKIISSLRKIDRLNREKVRIARELL